MVTRVGRAGDSSPLLHLALHRTKLATAPFSSTSLVVTAQVMVALCSPKYLGGYEVARGQVGFTFLHPLQTTTKDTCLSVTHPPLWMPLGPLELNCSSTSMSGAYPSKKQTQNKKPRCSTLEASSVGQKKHNPQGPS